MISFHKTSKSLLSFFTVDVANTSFPLIFLIFPATPTSQVPYIIYKFLLAVFETFRSKQNYSPHYKLLRAV